MRTVAIIGAGNGGHSAAFELAQKGFRIHLQDIDEKVVEGIRAQGGIQASGKKEGFTPISLVTRNMEEAVQEVETILLTVPRYAHREVALTLSAHLKENQRILLCPGSTAGELEFAKALREKGKGNPVSTLATLPYAARVQGPGKILISLVLKTVLFATFPGKKTDEEAIHFRDFFPSISKVSNVLEVSLNNGNPITHPVPTLLNAARIERGEVFLFYREGITPSIARINQKLDGERLALCRSFGFREIPLTERLYMIGYADRLYPNPFEAYNKSEAFAPILAPKTLQDRYIYEDVPYGLVTYASLGKHLGVPTPTMNFVVELANQVTGVDFWQSGMTLGRLGLDRLDLPGLQRFVEEGKSPLVDWG